jgi:hypothetical protein
LLLCSVMPVMGQQDQRGNENRGNNNQGSYNRGNDQNRGNNQNRGNEQGRGNTRANNNYYSGMNSRVSQGNYGQYVQHDESRHGHDDRGGIGPGKAALIGGAGGAALGAVFGGGLKGTLIGGAAGAGIGAIGGKMAQGNDRDRR